jgi:hypothetical protein
MKKTALALTAVLALSFSMVAGTQVVGFVSANPFFGNFVPPAFQTPNKDPPVVTIKSPLNVTYFNNDVLLNFTVTQPDSWFERDIVCRIKNITYQLDGGQVVTLFESLHAELPATKQFSIILKGVADGQHTLHVKVTAESLYYPHPTYGLWSVEAYPLDVSQTIIFDVEPSPTIIIIATVSPLAIIGIALLVYFKKRKHAQIADKVQ